MTSRLVNKMPADFQQQQYEFAANIRQPDINPAPEGIEDRRMAIYRELFFNNVCDFLATSYPVLCEIYGEQGWLVLMREYFSQHLAHTPLFPQMPKEFLQYLQEERGAYPDDPPFLAELAHYEWVELALAVDTREVDDGSIDSQGDLFNGIPVMSPLAWTMAYRFPVQSICPDFQPTAVPDTPTYIVVYRDRHDDIGFLELNPVTARLIELVNDDRGLTGQNILEQIAGELKHPDPAVVIQGGREILSEMKAKHIIAGSK